MPKSYRNKRNNKKHYKKNKKSQNAKMVFQSNPGSGAFRSASIAFASPSQYGRTQFQPVKSQIRPHREELISKTSPKPKIRGGAFSHILGAPTFQWILVQDSSQDSSIMYRILVLCIGFQYYVQDYSFMYKILVLCIGF